MLRKLVFMSFSAIVAQTAVAQSTMSNEMQIMRSAEKHGAFIESFAQLARARKEGEALALLDPQSIKGVSESQILQAFRDSVFPFFADYEKMKNYTMNTNAHTPDGRVGVWHYTFIVDKQGNTKPFSIALINADDGPRVLSILFGCVKGRHPAIPPCD